MPNKMPRVVAGDGYGGSGGGFFPADAGALVDLVYERRDGLAFGPGEVRAE